MMILPASDSSESPPIRRSLSVVSRLLVTRSLVDKPRRLRQLVKLSPVFFRWPPDCLYTLHVPDQFENESSASCSINRRRSKHSDRQHLIDPSDAVTITVQFAKLSDGTNHVETNQVNRASKQLAVMIQNSAYQPPALVTVDKDCEG
jgi:hypothetical protein